MVKTFCLEEITIELVVKSKKLKRLRKLKRRTSRGCGLYCRVVEWGSSSRAEQIESSLFIVLATEERKKKKNDVWQSGLLKKKKNGGEGFSFRGSLQISSFQESIL